MKSKGIRLYMPASTDDNVVFHQSAHLDESDSYIDGEKVDLVFPMGKSFLPLPTNGHGEPLGNERILGYLAKIFGRNWVSGKMMIIP